jgi:hypothetical protein
MPLTVPAAQLPKMLGVTDVRIELTPPRATLTDATLA